MEDIPKYGQVRFRHIALRNGHRVTLAFKPLVEGSAEFVTYKLAVARYNPTHEVQQFSKQRGREITFNRITLPPNRANGHPYVFDVSVQRDPPETLTTQFINWLVDRGVLPLMFMARDPAAIPRRYLSHRWEEGRGLVNI